MHIHRKIISAGLIISVLIGVVSTAGCNKKSVSGVKKVAKDSAWFDSTVTEIDNIANSEKLEWCECDIVGVYKDGIVISFQGQYVLPDNFDWEKDSFNDYYFYNLDYYSTDGKLIHSVDVSKAFPDNDKIEIDDFVISNGTVKCKFIDYTDGNGKNCLAVIDPETGSFGEFEEEKNAAEDITITDDMRLERTVEIGAYSVSYYNTTKSYVMVIGNNGKSKAVDLSVDIPFADIIHISGYIIISETEILLVCMSNDVRLAYLDLDNGKARACDDEYSWLSGINVFSRMSSFDGRTYITNQDGIKCVNTATKELEEAVSFNDCYLNKYEIAGMNLISVKDDRYILAGVTGRDDALRISPETIEVPRIAVLEKAAKNPNAGKIILTAAAVGRAEISYPVCEAIRVFNETNKDYFIQLENNYNTADYFDYSGVESDDDLMSIYYNGASVLGSQVAGDMIAGKGPDIVLNASDFSLILSEEYLLDLNSYADGKNGINKNDYFANVIDAVQQDGKLLYMPMDFQVNGIPADRSDIRDSQTGFTFDEYAEYVDVICNGSDPMNDTQLGIMCTLFSAMSETCIHGDEVNFDNEDFRALCGYVKENVFDNPNRVNTQDDLDFYNGFGFFLRYYGYSAINKTILGYPSPDGRGPVISVDTSLGISASAPSAVADGAWEFIKLCLSDSIQEEVVRNYGNPVSTKAFDSTAAIALKNYNDYAATMSYWLPLDESVIASYKNVLMSGSVMDTTDPAVLSVIREEIPPYFVDQKSLDEVLVIIQDRVTTIVAER